MARLNIKLQEMIERGQFNFDFRCLLDEIRRVRVGLDPIHTFDLDVLCDAGFTVKTRPLSAAPAKHDDAMHDRVLDFPGNGGGAAPVWRTGCSMVNMVDDPRGPDAAHGELRAMRFKCVPFSRTARLALPLIERALTLTRLAICLAGWASALSDDMSDAFL